MAQIFHRSANTISRVTIFGAIFIVGFIMWVVGGIIRSPFFTNQGVEREQPRAARCARCCATTPGR